MNPDCLKHALTGDEQQQFEQQGYLIQPDVLTPRQLQLGNDLADHMMAQRREGSVLPHVPSSHPNIIGTQPQLLEFIDHPHLFPKIWGILGWNIYLYHSHFDITPPGKAPQDKPYAWHQDSRRVNDEIETSPRPRLSVKIGIAFSDISRADRGNTLIVPGSHLQDELLVEDAERSCPPEAIPLCLFPGSAVIIDRRIWHSRSFNSSRHTRKILWLGYAYRWLQPKDDMTVQHLIEDASPIRRQLLGDRPSNDDLYNPKPDSVPLRNWLKTHRSLVTKKSKSHNPAQQLMKVF